MFVDTRDAKDCEFVNLAQPLGTCYDDSISVLKSAESALTGYGLYSFLVARPLIEREEPYLIKTFPVLVPEPFLNCVG